MDNCHCSEVHAFFRFEPQHIQFLLVMNDSLLQQYVILAQLRCGFYFGDFLAAVCLGVGLQMWYLAGMAKG